MTNNKHHYSIQRRYRILLVGIIILIVILLIFSLFHWIKSPWPMPYPEKKFHKAHIIGGFSAITPEKVIKAAATGIQVEFQYGDPPAEDSELGQKLHSLHMKVVDGFIASYLHDYECQRSRSMTSPPATLSIYCSQDTYSTFSSEETFLAAIAAHLKHVANNHLIIGYWVLDDWVPWDKGSAKQLLIKIHTLIQQFTPDRPAICGFGGTLTANHTFGWADWLADNFSPDGCDEVGLYIYATSISAASQIPSPETYDWSMSSILPVIFRSLQQRGWNIAKEPFIGIGQAFGGFIANSNRYRLAPTSSYIEMQSKSFCAHGAIGLAFYAWSDSEIGALSQSPMTSREIEIGIQNGIRACKQYWKQTSSIAN
ncbi:hypothetical protein [Dictyobacter formicarum]|uniref:GH18 domain-containing protein n=1 Tax=Dictyobacter formicarum TaxID=2778368 RepID=A0ABQ3VAE1_9CHLR|nr:hypothetical protein [Dictyobacter formicarum]GHO82734.1 hypothetical protein KSZ_07400 [Dictyobacter formicarum]